MMSLAAYVAKEGDASTCGDRRGCPQREENEGTGRKISDLGVTFAVKDGKNIEFA